MIPRPDDSPLRLALDLWSAKAMVWAATFGRDAELTREANLFSSIATGVSLSAIAVAETFARPAG